MMIDTVESASVPDENVSRASVPDESVSRASVPDNPRNRPDKMTAEEERLWCKAVKVFLLSGAKKKTAYVPGEDGLCNSIPVATPYAVASWLVGNGREHLAGLGFDYLPHQQTPYRYLIELAGRMAGKGPYPLGQQEGVPVGLVFSPLVYGWYIWPQGEPVPLVSEVGPIKRPYGAKSEDVDYWRGMVRNRQNRLARLEPSLKRALAKRARLKEELETRLERLEIRIADKQEQVLAVRGDLALMQELLREAQGQALEGNH